MGPSGNGQSGGKSGLSDLQSGSEVATSSHEDPLDMSSVNLQSENEDVSENTVKLEAGSLVNSFWNKARKKLKDKVNFDI